MPGTRIRSIEWMPFVAIFIVLLSGDLMAQGNIAGFPVHAQDPRHDQLEIFGITIGQSPLSRITDRFPSASIEERGDAASNRVVCLMAAEKDSVVRVEFISNNDMAPEGQVTGITVRAYAPATPTPSNCHRIRPAFPIETRGSLRIGMSREEVTHLLGAPSKGTATDLLYDETFAQPMGRKERARVERLPGKHKAEDFYDIWETRIQIKVLRDKVVGFSISHMSS